MFLIWFDDDSIPGDTDIGQKHPWHLDIPHPYPLTEDDIISLYSPERLLTLKLEQWKPEGETNHGKELDSLLK